MGKSSLWEHTLIHHLCERCATQWRFRFTLPKVHEVELEGVRLDVSELSLIMRNNLLLGRYEVQERQLAGKYLKASDAVLEIGGAIGFLGLFCQKRLGISQYMSIEANPRTARQLTRNYALNEIKANFLQAALAQADGQIELNVSTEFWANSIVSPQSAGEVVSVPALSFCSLLRKVPFSFNAFIVDIEGAEKFINWQLLPARVDKVLMELHPRIIGVRAMYRIIADLTTLGFEVEDEESGTFYFSRV